MTPEEWQRIEAIFQSALDRMPDERDAFVYEACAGNESIEREVHSLLFRELQARGFLSRPAIAGAVRNAVAESASLHPGERSGGKSPAAGDRIGHYRILESLGSGGMGVVYKAEDPDLGRFVALKFVSDELAGDTDALARFRREARAASALNHPNICTIYHIGEHEGRAYIAMEFLDGVSLKCRLSGGPLPLDELLLLANDIASGLDAADKAGIIHRDIKPANIFVTSLEHAKILDFGLAKLKDEGLPAHQGETTLTAADLTRPGRVAGTAAYMSPEQLRGWPLDSRTDIFSFGVLLYEMAVGKPAFEGASTADIFDAILNRAPVPAVQLNPELPQPLERIINKCLEKDRDRRYPHASELGADLRQVHRNAGEQRTGLGASARLRLATIVAALGMAALLTRASFWEMRRASSPASEAANKDTIVLAVTGNTTGDPVTSEILEQRLRTVLEQSSDLRVAPESSIRAALAQLGRRADARLTPELARDVCERIGGAAAAEVAVFSLEKRYVLSLNATNCRTGETLYGDEAKVDSKGALIDALGQLAGRFRARAEALKTYRAGRAAISAKGPKVALGYFDRAAAIDPGFAMAHAFRSQMQISMGEREMALQSIAKAWELRNRASSSDRFFIEHRYQRMVLGNLEKARQTCELWAENFPRDVLPHSFLAGEISTGVGNFQKAEEEGKISIELGADNPYGYHNLANSYILRNRTEEAEAVLNRAANRHLDIYEYVALRLQIAFLKGDRTEIERLASAGEGRVGAEAWIFDMHGSLLAYFGHLRQARLKWQRALDVSLATDNKENAAQHEAGLAFRAFLFGYPAEARKAADFALAYSRGRDVLAGVAVSLALLDDDRAQGLVNELGRRFPEDTFVRFSYLPVLRGLLALNRKSPGQAIRWLEVARPYELGWIGGASAGFSGSLLTLYVRGQAFLALGHGAEAADEFRTITANIGVVSNDPTIALAARLQLARALKMAGNRAGAKAAYEDFLSLWTNADPEIPLLREAKAELADIAK